MAHLILRFSVCCSQGIFELLWLIWSCIDTAVREISVFGCQLEGLRSKVHVDPANTRAVKVEKTSNPSRSKPEKWTEYPGPLYDEESGFGTIVSHIPYALAQIVILRN
jgi:hypothetical protein